MTALTAPTVQGPRRSRRGNRRRGLAAVAGICAAAILAAGIGWYRNATLSDEAADLQARLEHQLSQNAKAERDLQPVRDASAAADAAAGAYAETARQELRIATTMLARADLFVSALLASHTEEAAALLAEVHELASQWAALPAMSNKAGNDYDSLRASQGTF